MLKHRIAVVVLLAIVLPLLTGCGGSSLVGKWSIEQGQSIKGVPEEMELLKDGTGTLSNRGVTLGVTWKTENGRLYLTGSDGAITADYKLSGSALTLTMEEGSRAYKKKK
ncbi:hypothetical protein FACS189419_05410 [Planctomycetales bacterium]|nr:hypothetical protein FACS189419_05410 [Planctomycetales bacterium]